MALMEEDVRQAAILHHLAIIGEAAGRISPQLRERYPGIAWPLIVSLRNRAVHEYFGIDWVLIWKTIRNELPLRREQAEAILANEFGG